MKSIRDILVSDHENLTIWIHGPSRFVGFNLARVRPILAGSAGRWLVE